MLSVTFSCCSLEKSTDLHSTNSCQTSHWLLAVKDNCVYIYIWTEMALCLNYNGRLFRECLPHNTQHGSTHSHINTHRHHSAYYTSGGAFVEKCNAKTWQCYNTNISTLCLSCLYNGWLSKSLISSIRRNNTGGTAPAAWPASHLCDWFLSVSVSALTAGCSQSPRQPQLLRHNDSQLFDRLHACHWICVRNLPFVPSLISQSHHNRSLHSSQKM